MSAECKAVLDSPPPPMLSMETRIENNSDGTRNWFVSKPNPGHLPLIFDVSRDTGGLATAPLLYIEPGGRELVFTWRSNADTNSFDVAVPRFAFTRTVPAVGKARPPITLLFPLEPAVATISQSPLDGAGFMRVGSHTDAWGGQFEAVDINAPFGTPILAPADGFVAHAYHESPDVRCNYAALSGYGNYVLLVTDDDVTIMLGHLAHGSVLVESGTFVRRGEPVAQVGHTGSGGVDHVHLVAMALGPEGVDSIPIRFEACGAARNVWTPRNGAACRAVGD